METIDCVVVGEVRHSRSAFQSVRQDKKAMSLNLFLKAVVSTNERVQRDEKYKERLRNECNGLRHEIKNAEQMALSLQETYPAAALAVRWHSQYRDRDIPVDNSNGVMFDIPCLVLRFSQAAYHRESKFRDGRNMIDAFL